MMEITTLTELRSNPEQAAEVAGLRYVSDEELGYTRKGKGRGFAYYDANGKHVKDKTLKARFKAFVIPPAWQDVWICADTTGHVQVTGTDAGGRKQYIYHPDWHALRDRVKFDSLLAFGRVLPAVRAQVKKDLRLKGLPKVKVTAAIVKLLEDTLVRIGNQQYAEANASYGLTTLRKKHVELDGNAVEFSFTGKSGVAHELSIRNKRIADIVRQCEELPGYELFKYLDDDGNKCLIDSSDVNAYLLDVSEQHFTAKDFRTWAGTRLCAETLYDLGCEQPDLKPEKRALEAVKQVAARLRNTVAVCRSSYIHPVLLELNETGSFHGSFEKHLKAAKNTSSGLDKAETALLSFMEATL